VSQLRPLDRYGSIKLKLGLVIVSAVAMTLVINELGIRWNFKPATRVVAAMALALLLVQFLARGMTSPLREMAAASGAMAGGDYSRRVRETSADEVGDLARAFNAMAAELAEIDRVRRDLVANVSHELRTPIGALRARLENLVDGVEAADADVLVAMLHQVERLGRLVSQLLDLSRLEAGTVPLDRRRFPVHTVLDDAAAESRLHAPGTPIEVDVAVDLVVDADPERIHQVIANLVANAVRHSPAGEVVRLVASAHTDGVAIEVLDLGPGIPAAEAQRVFERFYRADAARAASDGGAGLGLAIARWIVDLHGGSIRPEPNHPRGCRMVVTLPAAA
jgi:signal transduction histidine kinase